MTDWPHVERLAEALHAEDFDGIVTGHEPDGPLSDCPAAEDYIEHARLILARLEQDHD